MDSLRRMTFGGSDVGSFSKIWELKEQGGTGRRDFEQDADMAELMSAFQKQFPQGARSDELRRALGSRSDQTPALTTAASRFFARHLKEQEAGEAVVGLLSDAPTPAARACQIIAHVFIPSLSDPADLKAVCASGLPTILVEALAKIHAIAPPSEAPPKTASSHSLSTTGGGEAFAARAAQVVDQAGLLLLQLSTGACPGASVSVREWVVSAEGGEADAPGRQAAIAAAEELVRGGAIQRLVTLAVKTTEAPRPRPEAAFKAEVHAVSIILATLRFGLCQALSVHLRRTRPLEGLERALEGALQSREIPALMGVIGLFKVVLQCAVSATGVSDTALLVHLRELAVPAKLSVFLRTLAAQALPLATARDFSASSKRGAQGRGGGGADRGEEDRLGPSWAEAVATTTAVRTESQEMVFSETRIQTDTSSPRIQAAAGYAGEEVWADAQRTVMEYKSLRLAWELRGIRGSLREGGGEGQGGLTKDDLWALLQEGGWNIQYADELARRRLGVSDAMVTEVMKGRLAKYLEGMVRSHPAAMAMAEDYLRRYRGDERRASAYAYLDPHRQTILLLLEISKEMTFAGNLDSFAPLEPNSSPESPANFSPAMSPSHADMSAETSLEDSRGGHDASFRSRGTEAGRFVRNQQEEEVQETGPGRVVRNTEAFSALSDLFVEIPDDDMRIQVLDMALAVFAERGGPNNFMALQDSPLLQVGLVQLDVSSETLKARLFKVLEYTLTVAHGVPMRHLVLITRLLESRWAPASVRLVLGYITRWVQFDARLAGVFRDAGLLSLLVEQVVRGAHQLATVRTRPSSTRASRPLDMESGARDTESGGRDVESGGRGKQSGGRDVESDGRDFSEERKLGRDAGHGPTSGKKGKTLPWGASDFSAALSRAGLCREADTYKDVHSPNGSSASAAKVDDAAPAKVDDARAEVDSGAGGGGGGGGGEGAVCDAGGRSGGAGRGGRRARGGF